MNYGFNGVVPYSSIFIDASSSDFLYAMRRCATEVCPTDIRACIDRLHQVFSAESNTNLPLVCLSVRSAFDLYLRVKNFPKKSRIIISAVNIPSMVQIIRHHELVIVPWDVDAATLAPNADQLEILIKDHRTVAVLLAHIFGKRCAVEPYIDVVRKENLLRTANQRPEIAFIEDCAEIFFRTTPECYLGNPDSDLSLFSFGVIKHCTCFAGSIAKIKDSSIYQRMDALHNEYPTVPRLEFFSKLCKYQVLALGLNRPFITGYGTRFFRTIGVDHKRCAVGMLRAFPNDMMVKIRRQPCSATLALMDRRLTDSVLGLETSKLSKEKGDYVTQRLMSSAKCKNFISVPGYRCKNFNYWLYPIIVNCDPENFARQLNDLGVDAFTNATQLCIVEPDQEVLNDYPTLSKHFVRKAQFLRSLVYLPVHKNVPYQYLDQICLAVEACCPAGNVFIKSKL